MADQIFLWKGNPLGNIDDPTQWTPLLAGPDNTFPGAMLTLRFTPKIRLASTT